MSMTDAGNSRWGRGDAGRPLSLPRRLSVVRRAAWRAFALAATVTVCGSAAAQTPASPDPPSPSAALAPVSPPAAASGGISIDLFYRLLLGDVALQRGDTVVAARSYLEAARESKDPRIARRAMEIALTARQRALALEAAKLWASLEPSAERPKQVVAALSAPGSDRDLPEAPADDDELKTRLVKLLSEAAASGTGVAEPFLQINRLFSQQADKQAVFRLIRELAQPYAASPEAHYAVALAAFNTGLSDPATAKAAQAEVDRALELKPDWDRAAILKAEIIDKRSPDEAIGFLRAFVAAQPGSKAASAALAQFYVEQRRFNDARAVMQALWDREKDSRDLQFSVATIALRMKDYAEAERLFRDLKAAGYGEPGAMDLYLAQIAEETKRYADAIEFYRNVDEGDRAWLSKLRIGAMLGKLGRIDESKRWFEELPAVTVEQRIQRRQGEAQMLREAGDVPAAYALLSRSLDEHPDAPDLIYDLALVAERLDRIDEAESRLKRLVELKPDDPQALNALGYTLVDRTTRADEGFALIEKAHKLAPDDPFILDSMGWAMYRMGRVDEAEKYLRQAIAVRPDAEIAAHLGEVLWFKGDREGALAIWKEQLEANPDSPVLKETVRRLAP
jgi:tetratricopeptide (TPR) repeat protein